MPRAGSSPAAPTTLTGKIVVSYKDFDYSVIKSNRVRKRVRQFLYKQEQSDLTKKFNFITQDTNWVIFGESDAIIALHGCSSSKYRFLSCAFVPPKLHCLGCKKKMSEELLTHIRLMLL